MPSADPSLRDRLAVALIERTPQWSAMAACQALGVVSRMPLPRGVSRAAVQAYARVFNVALDEVEPDALAQGYGSFDAFFTRTLREGARVVDKSPEILVSPCDGRLREVVEIEEHGVVVAKGHAYTIEELLADGELARRFVGGMQAVI
ncbi:MAG: phosphatidylserine decarboxylase [Myxococcales bacterium]|nr:phosphatidylserine decarboxylase [Myxococcales bacterium]